VHGNLAGAELLQETTTAPRYRLHSIRDEHPGMYEVGENETGASIAGEYEVCADRFGLTDAELGRSAPISIEMAKDLDPKLRKMVTSLVDKILPDLKATGAGRNLRVQKVSITISSKEGHEAGRAAGDVFFKLP